ncbi:glutaredoxin family protein [Pseudorhodoferax sp. Leaf274]|uniref:glutaredoxin family protein n=1 Tax=Pseudorhodoferax sp. Leaf274 TaxID=1736318 RepID=UPI000703487A|nr:glutaredoxin family protein [Pseudorhodoferax sp. Leaf274]KQP45536.1 NrdH-redoxin [Pseudorhodoferax sp. Leaf274]
MASGSKHALAVSLLLGAGLCAAQAVYRSVGPDGRVTFSDRPVNTGPNTATTASRSGIPPAVPALPYELRQVAGRFPVTLYTGGDCAPCDSARQLLAARGVPFSERTVQSNEDIEALRRLAGDNSLPVVTIGGQRLKGFAPGEWTQYLDSAGYPRTSQLPPGYRAPPAQPLVAVRSAEPVDPPAPRSNASPAAAPAPAPTSTPAPSNPAGIVF